MVKFFLLSACSCKNGIIDPLDPITFPYLTTEKIGFFSPLYEFAAVKILSDTNLVAPYKLIGSEALSVEVFDLRGKMVANGEVSSSSNSISLEGLKDASYVVRTTQGQFLISIAK